MTKDSSNYENIALPEYNNLTVLELREIQRKTRDFIKQIQALYPNFVYYTKDERPKKARRGKITTGEELAIEAILAAAEVAPGTVAPLADQDLGQDNKTFETPLLRARLEAAVILAENSEELELLSQKFDDTSTEIGLAVKPIASAAYELLKPAAKRNGAIRTALVPALDHYQDVRGARKKDEEEETTK